MDEVVVMEQRKLYIFFILALLTLLIYLYPSLSSSIHPSLDPSALLKA